mgnify:CR=1 FL=1
MWAFALAAAIAVLPETPAEVYDAVVVDLDSVPSADRPYIRWLSLWPVLPSRQDSLSSATSFWGNSLSWMEMQRLHLTEDGALWRIDLREWGWSKEAWEALAATDVYFATTVGYHRGWIDPKVEAAVRYATGSSKAVLRADTFLARTSLDGAKKDGFFREGFYSKFLNLPKTDKELKDVLGAKEKVKVPAVTGYDVFIFLLKGGGTSESGVALHNRVLQVQRTLIGPDEATFYWESLDVDNDTGEGSINKQFGGTLNRAGGEQIFSLPNGLHGYFACNAKGERISEVPTGIAQGNHPKEKVVVLGWQCNYCHGPNGGINGFVDEQKPLVLGKKTALAIVSKGHVDKQAELELKQRNETYHLSDLKETTLKHRKAYAAAVLEATELKPDENSKNYVGWVTDYLYGPVDRETAIRETGFGKDFDYYVQHAGDVNSLTFLNVPPGKISRSKFEEDYPRLMQAKAWPWEVKK